MNEIPDFDHKYDIVPCAIFKDHSYIFHSTRTKFREVIGLYLHEMAVNVAETMASFHENQCILIVIRSNDGEIAKIYEFSPKIDDLKPVTSAISFGEAVKPGAPSDAFVDAVQDAGGSDSFVKMLRNASKKE